MDEGHVLRGPEPAVPIPEDSLGKQLYESLKEKKDLPDALIHAITGKTVSYAEILSKSCRLAKALRNSGFKQDDVIGIFSENNLDYYCPIIASLYMGFIVTPFNPTYTTNELIHVAAISEPAMIFCSEATLATTLEVKQELKFIKNVVIIDTDKTNIFENLDQFIFNNTDIDLDVLDFQPIHINSSDQVAFILYSSGTTGLPKGTMLTHKNISATIALTRDERYTRKFEPGQSNALGLLPFFHSLGLVVLLRCLVYGRKLVVLPSFNPQTFLQTVQDYQISTLHLVPPLANFLAKSALIADYDLSCVKILSCGAAPLSKQIEEVLKDRLKAEMFRQAYGLTETTFCVLGFGLQENRAGSCGRVLPYLAAKIVGADGRALGPGEKGELYFKGEFVMKEYAKDADSTRLVLDEEGWLATGDVGYYDEDGFFFIVDRVKEIIKYKGFQVAPAELEALLVLHPDIEDVGVIGIPDEDAGELPLAFVVLHPEKSVVEQDTQAYVESSENSLLRILHPEKCSVTEQEIQEYVKKNLSPQKWLRGGVKFVNRIPRTSSGKIVRRELRELLKVMQPHG